MHVENELVEFVTIGEQEYDEVIEENEEEVLVQEKFSEPPVTDTADTAPAQGKPRCITHIYTHTHTHLRCKNFMISTCHGTQLGCAVFPARVD
jgi:hypothetical protein